ncbi:MAG TPA: AP endonuclease [Candidatus Atribacteria bacterium]|nr:AP endonuclease [Candidatus Atribacteria bacterium]
MQFSLCIDSIYPEENLKEKLKKIKQAGFSYIEFWDWRDKDLNLIINSGLKVTNFSGNRISSLILDDKEKVIGEINVSLKIARKLECKQIMLLSDVLKSDGSVEASPKNREEKLLHLYENLKEIIKIAEKEKVLFALEPLNTIKDHKNYFLDSFQITLELVKSVNSEYLKILYDIYHMQIMEGNILDTLQKYHQFIGYIHIANVPYRCEPWIGELDYNFILKELSKVYSGFVGFEFFVKEKSFSYEKLYDWVQSIDL